MLVGVALEREARRVAVDVAEVAGAVQRDIDAGAADLVDHAVALLAFEHGHAETFEARHTTDVEARNGRAGVTLAGGKGRAGRKGESRESCEREKGRFHVFILHSLDVEQCWHCGRFASGWCLAGTQSTYGRNRRNKLG